MPLDGPPHRERLVEDFGGVLLVQTRDDREQVPRRDDALIQEGSTTMTVTTPVEAARALAPLIREHADTSERDRRIPAPVLQGLVDADFFRLFAPRALGGAEADPLTVCRVVGEIAKVDGATAWCVMVGATYSLLGGLLPAEAAREIFSGPRSVVAGAFRLNWIARAVEGGYVVSGRWSLGSGIEHATWVLGGCRVFDGEVPRQGPNGGSVPLSAFFPKAEVEVLDTWRSAGLRGTGSHDYQVSELFVPTHRTTWWSREPIAPGPLYTMPAVALIATAIGSVSHGIARHAIDAVKELAAVKTPSRSVTVLRERPVTQAQLGEAEGLLRAGRAFLSESVEASWQTARQGQRLTWEQRGLMWLAATQATSLASRAVDLMFTAGGASSVHASFPLERCLRDIRTAAQHITVIPTNYEIAGQMFMGADMEQTLWSVDSRT